MLRALPACFPRFSLTNRATSRLVCRQSLTRIPRGRVSTAGRKLPEKFSTLGPQRRPKRIDYRGARISLFGIRILSVYAMLGRLHARYR